ncbi:transposase [Acetoanaerobium pronyense]|uniref:Transposase n=1 Tax=Acetoanaerobium pronyense TaxID=1482736 RepID=A0ABS4KL35_9FIRM|nr:DUF6017 domain-containing protein [Acetoanaerobium pronyense]MBP2028495.1 transposase [Acetoanaerobium pronyense]
MFNQKKFSVNDIYQNSFHQIPTFFFLDEFPKVCDKAIILYSILKSRYELSVKNRWFDKDGNVYLIMKREQMEKILRCSDKTITKCINELKEYNLLIEVRQGKGRPNLIYLTYPDIDKIIKENQDEDLIDFKELDNVDDSNEIIENLSEKDDSHQPLANTMNRKSYDSTQSIENTIKYKNSTLSEKHEKNQLKKPPLETVENTMNRKNSGSRPVNITTLNRYIDNNINKIYNHSFIQKELDKEHDKIKNTEGMNERKYKNIQNLEKEIISDKTRDLNEHIVKDNIDYELLLEKNDSDIVNDITEILVDTVSSTKRDFRINGCNTSANLVKSRFLKLNHMHIEFVIDCLSRNTTEIRDIRSYLMTTLYNAPNSMNLYYNSKTNHDLNH